MCMTLLLRLIAALLLTLTLATAPLVFPGDTVTPVLAGDDGGDDNGKNDENGNSGENDDNDDGDDDDDGNRGHGNDPDGFDEDNPGRSGGTNAGGNAPPGQVVATEPYSVEVACEYDSDADETTCTFTGVSPQGGADVGHVDVPETDVCAEVVDGQYEYVDPDPNTRVTGYASPGNEGVVTLVLVGEVVTGSTATYWIKAGDGVFPAQGPGLDCSLAAGKEVPSTAIDTTLTGTAPAEAQAGSLAVRGYVCTDVPEDRTDYDWFGTCDPAGAGVPFTVAPAGSEQEPAQQETLADGAATFDGLTPGAYTVDLVDGAWCHAKADHVNTESEVMVEAATTSSVWIFICQAGSPGI